MALRIAYMGDIVGNAGRKVIEHAVPILRQKYRADLVIANAENAANGTGLTPDLYHKFVAAGIDGMTLGDHCFKKQQIYPILSKETNICRPANLSAKARGKGWMRLLTQVDGHPSDIPVVVIPVLCRVFMSQMPADSPFETVDAILDSLLSLSGPPPIVIVEIHGEATAEKTAMGWYLNGRVAAVIGSHTHIPTADQRILPLDMPEYPAEGINTKVEGGTAYITDMGMTGAQDSCLGRRADRVVKAMTTNVPSPYDVSEARPVAHGVLVTIDERTRRATKIRRLAVSLDDSL